MGRPAQLLSYPPGLGNDDLRHWIEFKATKFNSPEPRFECALFIPPDAMNTSYKSEYESTQMGEAGLRFLQPGSTASGKAPTAWSATTDAFAAGLCRNRKHNVSAGHRVPMPRPPGPRPARSSCPGHTRTNCAASRPG